MSWLPLRAATIALPMLALPFYAQAGCVTGAIVGGVAGHVAGGHGLLGAGAGCVAGHEISKHNAERAQQQQSAPPPSGNQTQPQ